MLKVKKDAKDCFVRLVSKIGIPIYFYRLPYAKTVSLGVMVKAGTRDEKSQEAGLAHATEHMVFRSTNMQKKDFKARIEDVGGDINANTSKERTFYHCHLPHKKMERGFEILAQLVNPVSFKERDIKIEMNNIIQEMKMYQDDPTRYAVNLYLETVYGSHPLARRVIGFEKSVLSLRSEDFIRFTNRFYCPANFRFIIVGDVKTDKVQKLFDKYFANLNNKNQPANERESIIGAQPTKQKVEIARDIDQAHTFMGATTTPAKSRDHLALQIFSSMISGGMSFPLFKRVRENSEGLCYRVYAETLEYADLSNFFVYVGTEPKKRDKAIKLILKVIEESKDSQQLLDRTKSLIMGQLDFAFSSPGVILSQAVDFLSAKEEVPDYQKTIDKIKSIKLSEIKKAVEKYLDPKRLVRVTVLPKTNKKDAN